MPLGSSGCLTDVWLSKLKNTQAISDDALYDATDCVDASDDGADAYQEARDILQAHSVLNTNGRQLVAEEDCWHATLGFYCLGGAETEGLEGLRWLIARLIHTIRLIHVVNLADFEEVIHEQTIRSHEIHHAWLHEFALFDVTAIKFKVKLLSEIFLDVFNIS